MKYGIWNVAQPQPADVNALAQGGYAPLAAMILAARGLDSKARADEYLCCDVTLHDPFLMKDMDKAAQRVRRAVRAGEKIAVFGDYDVDGITATCLLTDFLRSMGADCLPYIPGRLEEGYGLNRIAIEHLRGLGVRLIVTVDCGITALEEARLCKQLGIDLVITDHHECKEFLPDAVAVVDPHRPDGGYPHLGLSGVGVAFKLASAVGGSQEAVLRQYADMVCLGTVADVMPLQGENRRFVAEGLEALRQTGRPGLAALMEESGCDRESLSATTVGYILAPRINAAGRMGQIELATELFLTRDEGRAKELASALCALNRQRQEVEQEIYRQAVEMLPKDGVPEAIVLADERWHQGVVGIVSSRIAEEYSCPTFLICLDGEHGKASSRSFGGFNLFSALTGLSKLLESYGGHELAAGFTIKRDNIQAFREAVCALARDYYTQGVPRTVLDADCAIRPELLTLNNVEALSCLEPCGNGCPKPVLVMEGLTVEKISQVGGGRHMRLRLRSGHHSFGAIYFSATAQSTYIAQGDVVDVAFAPQVNAFRGEKSVQMNLIDIRPHCQAACTIDTADYSALRSGIITPEAAGRLLPDRGTLALIWRYLDAAGQAQENAICLLRKVVRWSGKPLSLGTLLASLDIFAEVGLLTVTRQHKCMKISVLPWQDKVDLTQSRTMQTLTAAKESE